MPWPASTSIQLQSLQLTPVPGTSGNTWIANITVIVTLSTGQQLTIARTFNVPAAIVTALQAEAATLATAEGTTFTWP